MEEAGFLVGNSGEHRDGVVSAKEHEEDREILHGDSSSSSSEGASDVGVSSFRRDELDCSDLRRRKVSSVIKRRKEDYEPRRREDSESRRREGGLTRQNAIFKPTRKVVRIR